MVEHIKIQSTTPRIRYVADGELTSFDYPFAIFKAEDLQVYFNETLQTSDYTISGAGETDGGTVTFTSAPSVGTIITFARKLNIERTSDFQEGGALRANVLNGELDYQIACLQEVADNINRSMVLPPYAADTDVNLTLPAPAAGKAIVWNSAGTNLENSTVAVNELESTLAGYKTAAESAKEDAITAKNGAVSKASEAASSASTASTKAGEAAASAAAAASSMSSKANKDMDNLTTTGKATIVSLGMPDYSNYTAISSFPYTAPKDGVIVANISAHGSGNKVFLKINDFYVLGVNAGIIKGVAPISKGEVVTQEYAGTHSESIYFCPLKGV